MVRKIISAAVFLIFLVMVPIAGQAGAPMDTAKAGVDKVVAVAGDMGLALEARKEKIRELIGEFFDFDVLSRLTLGRHWKKFKPEQQKAFVSLYQTLLENVYIDRIIAYTDEKVVFEKEIMHSKKKAEVTSNIVTSSNKIPINYRMVIRGKEWKVYDVVIEGVSMVSNYRSQFNEILAKESPDQLIETLRERVS
jgi:phospholipid transport system substrate-binding protein